MKSVDALLRELSSAENRAARRYRKVAGWMRGRSGYFSLHRRAEVLSDAIARRENIDPEKFRIFRRRGSRAWRDALQSAIQQENERGGFHRRKSSTRK